MRVGVDVGGTFTDLVALEPDGALRVHKVASTPDDPSVGVVRAVEHLGASAIDVLVHGTTVATNALLERRGARIALVTTQGFEDLLWLRRQDRAALYDLSRDHPPPLVARDAVVGAAERMGPAGILLALTEAEVRRVVDAVRALRPPVEAVAVAFLFGFRHEEHERRVAAALAEALPGVPVAASHEVLPMFREYERISTTTAEAYLRPKVSAYLGRLRAPGVASWRIMSSSGGTLAPETAARHAASLALSGPAGGVVGARLVGAAAGIGDLLTLDMGGTSADASLIAGGAALSEGSGSVGGVPLALPAVLIETVSAGGGSIAWVDEGGALRVGPHSAGALPGPACYGRGGTAPTVTDACLALGWLDAAHPLADEVRLDPSAAERAVASLGVAAGAMGIVEVATAVMARALKRVSVARGVDPRRLTLLPFGGAGPLFGCALADALGMPRILIPPHPGVLSALGLAAAAERVDLVAPLHRPVRALTTEAIQAAFRPLLARVAGQLPGATLQRYADCRFAGQGYEVLVPVEADEPGSITSAFFASHRARYGYAEPGEAVEVVNLRVVGERPAPTPRFTADGVAVKRPKPGHRRILVRGGAVRANVLPLDALPAGFSFAGPAILSGLDATALVEPGWRATVQPSGALAVERDAR